MATRSYLEPLDGYNQIFEFQYRDNSDGRQSDHAIYLIGKYGACTAAIRKIQPGLQVRGGAISVPKMAYRAFPKLGAIIGVGIACGANQKIKMCDVLVSTKVHNYDKGKFQIGRFESRGEIIPASDYFIELFTRLARWPEEKIKERLTESNMHIPNIKSGMILSGPYVINDPKMKEIFMEDFAREAIGIEMEAAYLFAAVQQTTTDVIIVKAVCDFGDGEKNDIYQPTAAVLAADFVHMKLNNPLVSSQITHKKVCIINYV